MKRVKARTATDRKRIADLANKYNAKSYDENIAFAKNVIKKFPFSYFSILRGIRFKRFWDDVIEKTQFLNKHYAEKDITRLYYYINKITYIITCATCGKEFTKKIIPTEDAHYRFHCNLTCMVNDTVVQERMKATKEKNHTTTKDLLEKSKERNREKYGCDWYMQSQQFASKRNATWKSHGYDHPMHSKDIMQKMQDNLERQYGKGIICNWQIPSCIKKVHKTNMERYGA